MFVVFLYSVYFIASFNAKSLRIPLYFHTGSHKGNVQFIKNLPKMADFNVSLA